MNQLNTHAASAVELLTPFVDPDHPIRKNILVVRAYRGDATESGERRLKAMLGDAYESLHHDTIACDGRVVVFLPRCKAPGAVEAPTDFRLLTAEHHWALGEVDKQTEEVSRARSETIQRVPVDVARKLYALPGLEFVDVRRVNYWEFGRTKKRKSKPAPKDVVYFRFKGGYGLVAC